MPVNSKHLKRLQQGLEIHAKRIDELRKQIKLQNDEISAHSLIIALGGNKKLIKALSSLIDDAGFFDRIQGKELDFLKKIGVQLPPGSRIALTRNGKRSLRADVLVRTGEYAFTLTWENLKGFSTHPAND